MSYIYDNMAREMCKTNCEKCKKQITAPMGMYFGIFCNECSKIDNSLNLRVSNALPTTA